MRETEKSVEIWNINKMPQRVMQNTLFYEFMQIIRNN